MKKKHIKDPGSAITHFIGMLMAIFAAFPLLIKAAHEPSRIYLISLAIYAVMPDSFIRRKHNLSYL